ncbi:MAG TPA: cytidylate kinase-like family protein [Dehalococcoidia bacterium]|nr:cytidylate kinase-like family protein [Dehalococcoidia bacterium]
MPANVVALSVETGSAGYAIAHQVADRLGFRYYDWEITQEAAALAGVPPSDVAAAERVPGFFERFMRRLGAASAASIESTTGFIDPSPEIWDTALQTFSSDEYRKLIERVVKELAGSGDAVIVGHAGQYLLRDRPSTLRVLVHGSLAVRTQRLAVEQGISHEEAGAMIKQSDKDRRELLRRLYHFEWTDAAMYDIAVDTDRIPPEIAVEAIVSFANHVP